MTLRRVVRCVIVGVLATVCMFVVADIVARVMVVLLAVAWFWSLGLTDENRPDSTPMSAVGRDPAPAPAAPRVVRRRGGRR